MVLRRILINQINTEALEKILGVSPAFMRPPYGEYDEQVRAVAGSRNQTLVLWDFECVILVSLDL
jgi:hypothetical protein